jgi:hypothetical protein
MITSERVARRERALGRLAGLTGVISAGLWFASMLLGHAVTGPQSLGGAGGPITDADVLLTLHEQAHRQLLSSAADALHLLLVVPVGLFLVAALRRRRGPANHAWLWLPVVCAPPVLAALALAAHFEVQAIASTFVSGGPRTVARAHQLLAGSSALTAFRVIEEAARLLFACWIGAASLTAIDTGLVTRQLGYFGLATAVAEVTIPPAGDALFIGFLLAISSLALGYWPGGRPAAWDTGISTSNQTATGIAR